MKTILASMTALAAASVLATGCTMAPAENGEDVNAAGETAAASTPAAHAPASRVETVAPKTATVGEAKADTTEPGTSEDFTIMHFCNEATCSAAGGSCGVGPYCVEGCENSPVSCTAEVPAVNYVPSAGIGWLTITCTGTGNGVYTLQLNDGPMTWIPGLGWSPPITGWQNYVDPYQNPYVCQGPGSIWWAVDEASTFVEGQDFHATYVKVCADPGAGQFTAQSGICSGTVGEADEPQCVTVQVTYPQ